MTPTVPVPISEPSPTLTGISGSQWVIRNGNQPHAAVVPVTEPAPTMHFGAASNDVRWYETRPATTVVGSFCPDVIAAPGWRTTTSRQDAEASVRVTVAEASVLQSFPPDYPWAGSRSAQFQQVGNAFPPVLAEAVLRELLG